MYHYPKRREEEVNRLYGDRIRVYNTDFFANERTLEQYRYRGYNICVTDPPYNIGYKYDQYTDKMTEKDYLERLGSIVDCMPSVIIHYPEMLHKLSITIGKAPDRVISWTYNSNTPRQHRDIAFYGVKPNMHAVKQDYQNLDDIRIRRLINNGSVGCNLYDWWHIEQVKNVSSQKTAHPCQIPLTVMKNIIGILPPDAKFKRSVPTCGVVSGLQKSDKLNKWLWSNLRGRNVHNLNISNRRGGAAREIVLQTLYRSNIRGVCRAVDAK